MKTFDRRIECIPVSKTKSAFDLINRCPLTEDPDVAVKCRSRSFIDEFGVDEDEGFFHVETNGNNVHGILDCEFVAFFEREFVRVEELFIICEHDDERHVKDLL